MDYKRLKRLIGALMTAAAAFTLLWVLWGKDVQGIGLIAVAALMALGGLLHLFAPGEEPESVLTKLVKEAKSAEAAPEKTIVAPPKPAPAPKAAEPTVVKAEAPAAIKTPATKAKPKKASAKKTDA